MLTLVTVVLVSIVLGVTGIYLVLRRRKVHYWLAGDVTRGFQRLFQPKPTGPVHVMIAFVDHFEPGNGGVELPRQIDRVTAWVERYPQLADKHRDADGVKPQHTFFYPPHYDHADHLERIVGLCAAGYGEVEMHLHHDRQTPWPDDEASLRKKVVDCLADFGRFGVFRLPDGTQRFAFIHGDWALANALDGGHHCGINDELTILQEHGCFVEMTFPVSNEAQPRLANRMFYGQSSRDFPKGYDRLCYETKVGETERRGLLFIQGIIGLRWKSRTHGFTPSIEQSNLGVADKPTPSRIDYWIDKGIHVPGRPDWVFVKMHMHGAREIDWETLLGGPSHEMFDHLETKYNDGRRYVLHYVSAREMYNIARAAEDGRSGDPNDYRDYDVPRYVYLPRRDGRPGAQA